MSSDEERNSSPVLPKDSDRGSSVSSDFQDEYEELLRYAVVTPKFEPSVLGQPQPPLQLTADGRISNVPSDVCHQGSGRNPQLENSPQDSGTNSETPASSTRQSPTALHAVEEEVIMENRPFQSGMPLFSPAHSEDSDLQGSGSQRSSEVQVTELPIPDEKMKRVEDILDIWSGNLKTNVITELNKWRLTIIEQHRLEIKRQSEKHANQVTQFSNQVDSLKDLLQNYETSVKRKDEVISNLTNAIEKQKERLSVMKSFTQWRLEHAESRQEAYARNLADKHYTMTLIKKAWRAWHSIIQANWKDRVEKACRTRAEEVCVQLSNDYEAKIAQCNESIEEARAEIQRLHGDREHFEGSMKKAFMRGVCALNMEAMTMFQGRESKLENADQSNRREDAGPSQPVSFQPQTRTSLHMDAAQYDVSTSQMAPTGTSEHILSAPFSHQTTHQLQDDLRVPVIVSATTAGSGIQPAQQLPMTRVVTSAQQNAGKTITARITGRVDLVQKANRIGSNITSVGVTPPMSSIVVEKHHPITQQTISQATGMKYSRTAQHGSSSVTARSSGQSSRTHHPFIGVQTIKFRVPWD
ncbi:centrosomal protein POC5 isoform X1 [Pleurodeles waltl]|uniref:centrosomal protein POC5 isoform X1 n=1 Tax=Pleurodeles waltl TaxID=8319 RepID=UPI003709ACD6